MRLLLDTCVFLWLIGLPEHLPTRVRSLLESPDNEAAISVATLWEVLLKVGKRRIEFDTGGSSTLEFLSEQCAAHRLDVLPVVTDTLAALERLPAIHRDPFDRLLICQAIEHGMMIVTPDSAIQHYPVKTFW